MNSKQKSGSSGDDRAVVCNFMRSRMHLLHRSDRDGDRGYSRPPSAYGAKHAERGCALEGHTAIPPKTTLTSICACPGCHDRAWCWRRTRPRAQACWIAAAGHDCRVHRAGGLPIRHGDLCTDWQLDTSDLDAHVPVWREAVPGNGRSPLRGLPGR